MALTSRCARHSSSVVRAERRSGRDPGVVDEHVHVEPVEKRLDRRLVGDVELVVAGRVHVLAGEPIGDRLPDPLRPAVTTTRRLMRRAPSDRACPTGSSAARPRTRPRAGTCAATAARGRSPGARCSSTGWRATTYARGTVSPFCAAPTTAHSTTSGWPTRQCSISAGATQIPPTLIRSSARPRYQKKPSSSRSKRSPVRTVSPSNVRSVFSASSQ